LPETQPHDEFLELSALAASGQLTLEEQHRLDKHIADCSACREASKQYQVIVDRAIPAIAAHQDVIGEAGSDWSSRRAEHALFDRIDRKEKAKTVTAENDEGRRRPDDLPPGFPFGGQATWRGVWLLYAAGILLTIALGISAYRAGMRRNLSTARVTQPQADNQKELALEEKLSDAGHEREVARAEIQQRDRTIADLRNQLEGITVALDETRSAQERLDREATARGPGSQQDVVQQRAELAEKLSRAQANAETLQSKLDSLGQQSSQDLARTKTLEAEVNDLTQQLRQRDTTVDEQQELLAHDRDIRELMGARDLYIAEVYDVGRTGATQKPYGRVFYTRGKSLIFYAYDLDQQAGLKNARTFQAWGRRGPDQQQALNLGIFYVDSAAKKRWVLKFDDPKTLAQIDAVFVTVEPNGGSHKPSGQPLLFTYLKIEPNHP
jgi:hypothetical protein